MIPGPYEARHCPNIPTNCCDFGIVSLSQGREVCRVWERDDAERIAELLNSERGAASRAVRLLAQAVLTFAPDLAEELKTRWEAAKSENDEALNRFLEVLRAPEQQTPQPK